MNDLDINVNLARAMGWAHVKTDTNIQLNQNDCMVYGENLWCGVTDFLSAKFDYRDPVIFVAICKRWGLFIRHNVNMAFEEYGTKQYKADSIEKAAALCVIDAVKRGVK